MRLAWELGLIPRPAPRPKALRPKTRRHVIRICPGVRIFPHGHRRGFEKSCGKKLLIQMVMGRPPKRCAECRVLKFYWSYFYKSDPIKVMVVLGELARNGTIGSDQYKRVRKEERGSR